MTLNEFKAWFRGYTEQMGELPSAEQWGRIKQEIEAAVPFPAVSVPSVWHQSTINAMPGTYLRAGDILRPDLVPHAVSNTFAGSGLEIGA